MWGEADSPWCQQEREGESLAWSDKRWTRVRLRGAEGICGWRGQGVALWVMPVRGRRVLFPSHASVSIARNFSHSLERGREEYQGHKHGRTSPSLLPQATGFILSWAFFRLTKWEPANGNVCFCMYKFAGERNNPTLRLLFQTQMPMLLRCTPYSIGHPSRGTNWGARQGIYKHLDFFCVLCGGWGWLGGWGCLIPRKRTTWPLG